MANEDHSIIRNWNFDLGATLVQEYRDTLLYGDANDQSQVVSATLEAPNDPLLLLSASESQDIGNEYFADIDYADQAPEPAGVAPPSEGSPAAVTSIEDGRDDTLSEQGDAIVANEGYSQTEQKLMLEKAQLESRVELTEAIQGIKDLIREQGETLNEKVTAIKTDVALVTRDISSIKWFISLGLAAASIIVVAVNTVNANRVIDMKDQLKSETKNIVHDEMHKVLPGASNRSPKPSGQ